MSKRRQQSIKLTLILNNQKMVLLFPFAAVFNAAVAAAIDVYVNVMFCVYSIALCELAMTHMQLCFNE
jgi:hypothetical protein